VSAGVVSQNLINLDSATTHNKSSPGRKSGPQVNLKSVNKNSSPFKQLLDREGKSGEDDDSAINLKKLLNLLNMPDKELKAKLQQMDKEKLKQLRDMTEFVFMNLLKRLQMAKNNPKTNHNSISREKLLKLKERLGYLQEVLNKLNKSTKNGQVNSWIGNEGKKEISDQQRAKQPNGKLQGKTNSRTNTKSNSNKPNGSFKNIVQIDSAGDKHKTNIQANQGEGTKVALNEKEAGLNIFAENNSKENDGFGKHQKNGPALNPKVLTSINFHGSNEGNNESTRIAEGLAENLEKNGEMSLQEVMQNQKKNNESAGKHASDILLNDLKTGVKLKEAKGELKGFSFNGNYQKELNLSGGQTDGFSNTSQFNQQNQGQFAQLLSDNSSSSSTGSGVFTPDELAVLKGDNTISQISEQIKLLHKPAQNEVKVQLEPEFLGKVKLSLRVESGEVTAKFMVDNVLVKNQLDQNLAALRSNLVNQGFDVDQIEVKNESSLFDMDQEGQSDQQYDPQDQPGRENQNYGNNSGYLVDIQPEQLEEMIQSDPDKLKQMGLVNQNWMTMNTQYQRMNILA
jgi:flagellar hook-length control protein FliK